jgi:hypothetical protein
MFNPSANPKARFKAQSELERPPCLDFPTCIEEAAAGANEIDNSFVDVLL